LPRHVLGEVGQHLIRRGPLAVHEAVREQPGPVPQGLEQQGDQDGRGDREDRAAPVSRERPDSQDDARVHGREGCREQAVDNGALDDDVDVVQPVLEDRGRHRGRDSDEHDERRRGLRGAGHP